MAYKFQRGSAILSGALLQEGNVEVESGFELVIGNASMSEADLEQLDGITAGTAAASKAVVLDASKDVTGINDMTLAGDMILPQSSHLYLAGDGSAAKIVSTGGNAVSIFGAKAVFNGSSIEPDSDAGTDLGSSTKEFKDLYIDGVAYIDSLQADQLGAALDANSQAITNINVDSGAIDGTVIGANSAAAGTFAALAGTTGTFTGALSGSSKLEIGGTVRLDGVAAATAVAADLVYFRDADDNLMKGESFADVRDNLVYASVSGDATVAAGGALTIAADAVESGMLNDNVISGQTELAHADIADADELMISDGGTLKKVGVDSLRDHYYGSVSGDATIADGGVLTIAADAVHGSMLNDDVISAQTELAADGLAAADELMISDGGTLKKIGVDNLFLDGPGLLAEAAVTVADDYIMFLDGGATGDAKKESVADLAAAFAGEGIKATSGVLSLDLSEVTTAAIAAGDSLVFVDSDSSNVTRSETINDLSTLMAGDGLGASNAVLAVQVSGALAVADDYIGIPSSFAGAGLAPDVSNNWIGSLTLDLSEYSTVQVASGDKFLMLDSDGGTEQLETVDSLVEFMAGDGLAHSSGVLSLDLNELTAADVSVANDSIAIIDADGNATKKESIADLVAAMAGAGLSAGSGQLSVTGNDVALKADGDELAEGYNYFADISAANVGVDLPASPTVGDVIHVKAGNITGDYVLRVSCQGSHTIDGETTIDLESPYAAVSLVYVVANNWRIV